MHCVRVLYGSLVLTCLILASLMIGNELQLSLYLSWSMYSVDIQQLYVDLDGISLRIARSHIENYISSFFTHWDRGQR